MAKRARTTDIKLVPIGNSKGIRIPRVLLQKYKFADPLVLEETDRGILLRNKNENSLSWPDTYKAIAEADESWDDFDVTILDGLEDPEIGPSKI